MVVVLLDLSAPLFDLIQLGFLMLKRSPYKSPFFHQLNAFDPCTTIFPCFKSDCLVKHDFRHLWICPFLVKYQTVIFITKDFGRFCVFFNS